MVEYIEFIKSWPLYWQVPFVLIMSGFATAIIVKLMDVFREVMNSIVLIIRGWPPEHIQVKIDGEEDETDESK